MAEHMEPDSGGTILSLFERHPYLSACGVVYLLRQLSAETSHIALQRGDTSGMAGTLRLAHISLVPQSLHHV